MKSVAGKRNQLLDLLRLVFATLVLLSHAFEFTYGNRSHELFGRLTHTSMSFGEFGVDGFFLLSGFLIVQSWQRDPELLNFLRKRILRIVPGYLVAASLSVLVVGLVAPGVPHFFLRLGWPFLVSLLLLNQPFTPPVFPGIHVDLANGALWTIAYEFRCYLLVALLGVSGLLRRRGLWLVLTMVLMCAVVVQSHLRIFSWHSNRVIFGDLLADIRLTSTFLIGGCYYLFRERIRFVRWAALAAGLLLIAVDIWLPAFLEPALVLSGSYLLFYVGDASSHWKFAKRRFPDISYGVYLYGWPVLGLALWWFDPSPWVLFVTATPVCYALGWLSWHFVERPMLRLKKRATAPLPPA